MMKYVYGPVPSKRLGQSLGIDPVPFKTCDWNCVYCQLGRTSPPTNERRDYFPPEEIMAEVAAALAARRPGDIDWITFAGSGEPTLHASLGALIQRIKQLTPVPIAVITNGSLLTLPEVRAALRPADVVLPTVSAGSERPYRLIHRPLAELDFESFIAGVEAFRDEFPGQLWAEVMLLQGINDSTADLHDLAETLRRIRPDEIHVNSPTRPPCEPWVVPVSTESLTRARSILERVARVVLPAEQQLDLSGHEQATDAIVAVIERHPVSEEDLMRALGRWSPTEVRETLLGLERGGRAQLVTRGGQRFWSGTQARYVEEPPPAPGR